MINNIQTEKDQESSHSNPHFSGDFLNHLSLGSKHNSKKASDPKRVQPAIITEAPVDEEERHDTKPEPDPKNVTYNDKIRQSIQAGSFEENGSIATPTY